MAKVPSSLEDWVDLRDDEIDELVDRLKNVGIADLNLTEQEQLANFVADMLMQMSKVRMMMSFLT